jgi:acyl dehydratase
MGVNYGANRIRFMSPVPVGSRLRVGAKLLGVDDIAGGIQTTLEATFETEGAKKPSCVAELVFRTYFG